MNFNIHKYYNSFKRLFMTSTELFINPGWIENVFIIYYIAYVTISPYIWVFMYIQNGKNVLIFHFVGVD